MRVVDVAEMRKIEEATFGTLGFAESTIIENVGWQTSLFIQREILRDEDLPSEVCFLVGRGNNGADAVAAARHLYGEGIDCRIFLIFPDDEFSDELKKQLTMADSCGVKINELRHVDQLMGYFDQAVRSPVVIDGVLGTGLSLPISQYLFDIFNLINEEAAVIVSMDIASGVCGNTGMTSGVAVNADYTVAVGVPKLGTYLNEGPRHGGEIVTISAGFPEKAFEGGNKFLLSESSLQGLDHRRSKFAHKNSFGHCLVMGGSEGLTGAAVMASTAALKTGAGLVTAATWEDSLAELTSRLGPEVMTGVIPKPEVTDAVHKLLERFSAVVAGPGLGRRKEARSIVLGMLDVYQGPLLLDADALNALSLTEDATVFKNREAPLVLTPHIGEFSRLTGKSVEEILKDPVAHLKEAVDATKATIVLKDACTFLGFPSGEVFISYFPNDGMASGGSGDVLAGIIGGLLAQIAMEKKGGHPFHRTSDIFKAVCFGVLIHSLSGGEAAKKLGKRAMTARDIIECMPDTFLKIEETYRRPL